MADVALPDRRGTARTQWPPKIAPVRWRYYVVSKPGNMPRCACASAEADILSVVSVTA
jgi:hypothetical protein